MKTGIDSYCYHRYFGEVYPDQEDPGIRWTFQDFVNRAAELEVDGVSLESCFFDSLEPGWVDENSAKRVSVFVPDSFPFPTSLPLA